jgi:DNA (cytosine-5)-methyltransferase 1
LPNSDENKKPTFIEVCAGCGGLSTGFTNAGWEPLLINEIDKTCCQTLRRNHPDHASLVVEGSMTEIDVRDKSPDLLMGGVPCQAFSQAGERKGLEDPRGQLIVHFNRLIGECRPRAFLVENVKGLLTINGGETLKGVLALFENNGQYKVKYKVLNAKDYKVPQKRERIIIVGVRSDIGAEYHFPEPSPKRAVLKDVLLNVPASDGASYPESKRKVLDLVPPGGSWVDLPEEIQKSYMGKSFYSGGGRRGMARRLSMEEQSLTLTTSPAQKQTERCHPTETRPLNVREYARIQTFPDSYEFCGSTARKYRQIGNAVPVRLAEFLADSLKSVI